MITDAYSKKIVGLTVWRLLSVESSLKALKMVIGNRKNRGYPLMHHSDRGLQFCSNDYHKLLRENVINARMTAKYDPYENAIAERINGILKQSSL